MVKLPKLSTITKSVARSSQQRNEQLYRRLLQEEARIGGTLFGPVGKGGRREFFCLNERTWIWHEEWTDDQGQSHAVTTRYDVRPDGIIKAQDGQPYRELDKAEAANFMKAVDQYTDRMVNEVYTH